MRFQRIEFAEWASIFGGVLAGVAGIIVFCFLNFALKADVREVKSDIIERLVRIENKVDRVVEKAQ